MSEGGGKNPVTGIFSTIGGGLLLFFSVVAVIALILGGTTGRKPIRGSLTNVGDVFSFLGALLNFSTRSSVETFAPEDFYKNTNTIDGSSGDTRPIQLLPKAPPDVVPTSSKTVLKKPVTKDMSASSNQETYSETDIDGNPLIPLEPIKSPKR